MRSKQTTIGLLQGFSQKLLQTAMAAVLLCALVQAAPANATFINTGTLDVQPIGASNGEWFIEYINPGEQKTAQLQISNFSAETKNLTLYATDSQKSQDQTSFYVNKPEEVSRALSNWIQLPVNQLTLKGGESVIVSVNFSLPQNAGIGLHSGAVIVRENLRGIGMGGAEATPVAMEKGVRVYLNVTGTAITQGHTQSLSAAPSWNSYGITIGTQNTGTTDYETSYELQLQDLFGGTVKTGQTNVMAQPEEVWKETLAIKAPAFGIFMSSIREGEGQARFMQTVAFIPLWLPLMLLAFSSAWAWQRGNKKLVNAKTLALSFGNYAMVLKKTFSSLQLQKSIAYLSMLSIAVVSSTYIASMDAGIAKSQLLTQAPPTSYELTVKWGDFRKNVFLPRGYRQQWHGRIYFPNARVQILELLHFERNDQAEIVGDRTALRFNTTTGPDNDGVILRVTPTGDDVPIVRYENFDTDAIYEIAITDLLESPSIYPNGLFATWIKAELSEEEKMRLAALQSRELEELEGTAEVEATPSVAGAAPELKNLFIEELPATPETLSDFILQSNYVSKITEENQSTQVETDNILIQALEATPQVLQEVAATPELNFIFIPTDTVNFPPQDFSFDEDKMTVQDMGTIIFVQNKENPWNTYVSTSDFKLLSGNAIIPASALKITAGEPTTLTDEKRSDIRSGGINTFASDMDKSLLVNVDPQDNSKTIEDAIDPQTGETVQVSRNKQEIFILKPRLEINIPRGTPAGTYIGSLTLTSL